MQKVEPQPTYVFTSDIAQTSIFFFFNDTATTEIYTLSLHDALPISGVASQGATAGFAGISAGTRPPGADRRQPGVPYARDRSEEHTSELQSPCNLVCRLLLEKKKKTLRM